MASSVLLAALSIPTHSVADEVGNIDFTIEKEKNMRLSTLLGFATDPTRASLLNELGKAGLAGDVSPELKTLYNLMEVDFHPLTMVQNLKSSFEVIKGRHHLSKYLPQLEKLMVLRLLTQLSSVYKTVHLSTLLDLTSK